MSIRKGAMMKEPLLQQKGDRKAAKTRHLASVDQGLDLETGMSEKFSTQAKTFWANLTPKNIGLFVVQPDNWAACGIMVCYAWTIWTFWLDGLVPGDPADQNILTNIWGTEENVTDNSTGIERPAVIAHHHWAGVFAGIMCTCGLSIGVVYMLRKSQLVDQINQFRSLNREYDEQVKNLTGQCDLLTTANDQLKLDLSTFADLQDKIKEYAEKSGKDFTEIFNKSAAIFDGISKVQDNEQRLLLLRVVADVQFMDKSGGAGISEMEFKRFKSSLPSQFKVKLEQLGITFEMAAKGKDEATHEDMKEVIDRILEGVSLAPAS